VPAGPGRTRASGIRKDRGKRPLVPPWPSRMRGSGARRAEVSGPGHRCCAGVPGCRRGPIVRDPVPVTMVRTGDPGSPVMCPGGLRFGCAVSLAGSFSRVPAGSGRTRASGIGKSENPGNGFLRNEKRDGVGRRRPRPARPVVLFIGRAGVVALPPDQPAAEPGERKPGDWNLPPPIHLLRVCGFRQKK